MPANRGLESRAFAQRLAERAEAGPVATAGKTPVFSPVADVVTNGTRVDPDLRNRLQAWVDTLGPVARQQGVSVFFDVDPGSAPPRIGPYARGAFSMKLLSYGSHRRWISADGIQTFVRTVDPNGHDRTSYSLDRIGEWLLGLSATDLAALSAGRTRLDQVDPQIRDTMIRTACEVLPELTNVISERGTAAGLGLWFRPLIEWTNPKTGKTESFPLRVAPHSIKIPEPPPPGSGAAVVEPDSAPLSKAVPGPLRFDDGALLSLRELMAKANAAFGVSYQWDQRLDQSWYFLRGSFTRPALEHALAAITEIPPIRVRVKEDLKQTQRVLDFLGRGDQTLLNGKLTYSSAAHTDLAVPAEAFVRGDTISLTKLLNSDPRSVAALVNACHTEGLTPDTVVTMRPSLELRIDWGGHSPGSLFANYFPIFLE